MASIWETLGFRFSPYDANPLKACQEDVELLVGREKEMTELCMTLSASDHGAFIISGVPGVGKTSFFNVTQFLLESSQAPCGPHLMCARSLCAIQEGDGVREVAQRALSTLIRSVEQYCAISTRPVPTETQKLSKWIGDVGSGGFAFGINIAGFGGNFGRTVALPKFNDASFERILDSLQCVVGEIVTVLNFDGAFVVLDNLENLEEEQVASLLMGFRDTLFTCPKLWWILIGQSGLGGSISTIDSRVFERLAGVGLELRPVGIKALHSAIEKRVKRFHTSGDGNAPLPEEVHKHLYHAGSGEMRFVFKYSSDICTKFLSGVMHSVIVANRGVARPVAEAEVVKSLGRLLVKHQIPIDRAESVLKHIVQEDLDSLKLKPKDREVLRLIGEKGSAKAGQFQEFGLKTTQDFSSNYLSRMHRQNLLVRRQAGRNVDYLLRGVAALAAEYRLLS